MGQLVISHVQLLPLIVARNRGERTAFSSPDLGLSQVAVLLDEEGVHFPTSECISWPDAELAADQQLVCFVLRGGQLSRVQFYSEDSERLYSLMPTTLAPTFLISGIPMHRVKGTDPYNDTLQKIQALQPIRGRVFDTSTGLGYTAIQLAKSADQVVTVEIEPTVLEIARINPWSRELFDSPKIISMLGDSFEVVREFDDESFDCVMHDPPRFSLAGDLYSQAFYAQIYRVLRRRGRMLHYIGDLDSKSGHGVMKGVVRRLLSVGFSRVVQKPEAFGVLAAK